ncbi:hypothetical protein [uncultured Ruminococcus sp.]|uniref:hypothetical protein n=2 Tax=uncultured Ruminococcus sp. TaxID=165186 RepID=UPI00260FBF2B|nr:hypothetical protein [uncultured Ruminococcus sp.]
MSGCKAAMVSYTNANQARRTLQRYGYSSEIRRLEHLGPEGCGFVLLVQGDCGKISDILTSEGVPFREMQEGREMW